MCDLFRTRLLFESEWFYPGAKRDRFFRAQEFEVVKQGCSRNQVIRRHVLAHERYMWVTTEPWRTSVCLVPVVIAGLRQREVGILL